jgi:hypothetical protein
MTKNDQSGLQCSQFEALLSDALDGLLTGEKLEAFEAHSHGCRSCGPLFNDALNGMQWLRKLEEVEPPRNLVHNILAATSAAVVTEQAPRQERLPATETGWRRVVLPILNGARQPRFVTSFAMAFFSISLTLTMAGVRLGDLAHMASHPGSIGKAAILQYTQVENRVVKYYENMRLVYEIESRVRELRKAADVPREENKQPDRQKQNRNMNENNDDTSERPENRQDRYSQGLDNSVIASLNMSNEGA